MDLTELLKKVKILADIEYNDDDELLMFHTEFASSFILDLVTTDTDWRPLVESSVYYVYAVAAYVAYLYENKGNINIKYGKDGAPETLPPQVTSIIQKLRLEVNTKRRLGGDYSGQE